MTSSKLILIAVSDTLLSQALAEEAKRKGLLPVVVDDGNSALSRLKELHPDLLISDITLSGIDGYDLLAAKSLDTSVARIPVIVVSNIGLPVDMKRLPSVGIREYFIKTHIEPNEVMTKVCEVLNIPALAASSTKPAKMSKILWVEDDRFLSDILSKKFTSLGYDLIKANNGNDALKLAESENPDIIMLDIVMPDLNGFDVLQRLKMQEKFKKTPVIMLSNLSLSSDIEKSNKLGAAGFIVKAAASLDEIVGQVGRLIGAAK